MRTLQLEERSVVGYLKGFLFIKYCFVLSLVFAGPHQTVVENYMTD